jgi:hypothetical protein
MTQELTQEQNQELNQKVVKDQHRSVSMPKRQSGMSMFGIMIILLVVGAVASVASQLAPLYLDNNTVSKILDDMAVEDGLSSKRDDAIEKLITNRLRINNVRDFKVRDNIDISRSRDGVELVMDYEVRMKLVGNIDMIVSFEKTIKLRS